MSKPIRVGLVGAGRWGRNIIRAVRAGTDFELASVVSGNPETAGLAGAGCRIVSDWRMLAREGHRGGQIDAAIVATPPATHAEMVKTLVEAGLPVLVEKPLTANLREAELLLEQVGRANGYVLVDHVHLFSPAWIELKKLLPGLGPITRLHGDAGAWGPFRPDTDVLWDWGPHDAAFCLGALGSPPDNLQAVLREQRMVDGASGQSLLLEATHASGAEIRIELNNLRETKARRFTVEGARGSLIYDDRVSDKLVRFGGGDLSPQPIEIASTQPLDAALAAFATAIRSGRGGTADLAFGVQIVRMLDGWQRVLRLAA